MAIDYVSLENRLFEILSKYLYKTKYVDLKDSSYANQFDSSRVMVNYLSDESIWFFRIKKVNSLEINYYFGLNTENDIKLILKFSIDKSKSFFEFFKSGKIAIKIKFTKKGTEIFNSMKEIFTIKNPAGKEIKHNYIMLIFEEESEIIPVITNLINLIDFDYGDECLLIKGFKENVIKKETELIYFDEEDYEDYFEKVIYEFDFNLFEKNESEEGLISEDYIDDSGGESIKKERELSINKFIADSEDYQFSVEKAISEIDCTLFEKNHVNESLSEKFDDFIESPIFDIFSRGLTDEECSGLVIRIKNDIADDKISGDAADIQDFYFEQYKSIKKQYSLNNFLNEYLKSDDFDRLLKRYHDYSEDMILAIIAHVRNDISEDGSMDNDKVILKIEYYFKAETNKNIYFNQIDEIKDDSSYYKIKYNLISEEFDEILNYIQMKISEGYHIKNIKHCLIDRIKEKVDLNREEARLKLRKLLNDPSFIEKNNITQEQSDKISEYVGDLIYKNKIRSDEIYEDTLLVIRGRYL